MLMKLLQLRHLKQIDVEQNMLSCGLEMAELMRSVYLRRIAELGTQRQHLNYAHLSQVYDYNCSCW